MGVPAKSFRMALGALIIKEKLGISDRETVEQIRENPYLQYFIGQLTYSNELPFDPSPRRHSSQVKLKTLLSMSNLTHFLPKYQLKYDSICSFIVEKKLFGTSLSSRERRNN